MATLFPGYFALVMATGIVTIGAEQQELSRLADGLYVVAGVAYVILVVLTVARLVRFPRRLIDDLTSHAKGFAFLTIVAGTNVLGSASGITQGWWDLAWVLWWISMCLWAVLVYATLIAVVLRSPKPGLGAGINGTWFLLTVSTESVAVLGALLLPFHPSETLAFLCLAAFLLGIVLYLIVMTMVFLRWTFHELEPTEAAPPAWIAAGAVAITVLAGSNLLGVAGTLGEALSPDVEAVVGRIDRVAPVIEGMVVLAWATATFWFPLMIAIGVWRHLIRRVPLRYDPAYWALVFPLGMYSVATFKMLAVLGPSTLDWLPKVALIVAAAAWTAAFVGLVHRGALGVARRRHPSPT
ncbi:MAG: tellurite resistance/C4-dicarboxylate transporter family protein [Acidimicrobiales bacterium]|nr:tellurite resistance/C4-dicarboxylate transporter family protein [Acidimicrobiales bacterium]